jgi:tetratricopeptide (TPR) repeat protein
MTAKPGAAAPTGRLKIAVYGICLNEVAFVDRFMDSCAGADMVVIADTGSTDGTIEAFRRRGAIVHSIDITPWRFDHARQAALELVPEHVDVCVSLDLDQVLAHNWRGILDRHWKAPANHVYYTLSWARNHDGSPRNVLDNRIHARHGFVWKYPVHECVLPAEGVITHTLVIRHLRIDHQPDTEKSRGQYLGLLELAVREDPASPRHAHYLGREYFYLGRHEDAIAELGRHIGMATPAHDMERSLSLRLSAESNDALGDADSALALYRQAAEESPEARGPLVDYAWALYQRERWAECYPIAKRAAATTSDAGAYGTSSDTGVIPEDMACICGWRLGRLPEALAYGRKALQLAPGIERIRLNVERMEAALGDRARPTADPDQLTAGGVVKLT